MKILAFNPLAGWGRHTYKAAPIRIELSDSVAQFLPVSRALMRKGDLHQLSYYWFPQRDRILTNTYQLKWYNFWDALTRQRTDGALVRLITPIYPGELVEDADARLIDFVGEFVPVLDEFLPD